MATPGPSTVVDASAILAGAASKFPSIAIEREEAIQVDLHYLAAYDPNPIDVAQLSTSPSPYLLSLARDSTQSLIAALFAQPITRTHDGPVATLPSDPNPELLALPREKPLPKKREATKWEKFANAKGIQHRKRDRYEFDEERQEWVPRWGRGGSNKKEEEQWIHEVKAGADADFDPVLSAREARKSRTLKNTKAALKNAGVTKAAQAAEQKAAAERRSQQTATKAELEKGLVRSRGATASMGKFDKKLEGEPKVRGQKRKFEPTALPSASTEAAQNRAILSSLSASSSSAATKRAKAAHGGQKYTAGEGKDDVVNSRRAVRFASKGQGARAMVEGKKGGKAGKGKGRR